MTTATALSALALLAAASALRVPAPLRARLASGFYGAGAAFDAPRAAMDVRLVAHNARLFNKPGSTIWRMADVLFRETETALTKHLDETSKKLDDLRGGRDGTQNAALNAQQLAAIEDLKRDAIETRGKLRQVQFELRRDIASLQNRLRLFDIALVPALLLVVAVLMAWVRQARRTRRQA